MKYQDFFTEHGDKAVMCYGGAGFTIENLYQAIKDRIKDERKLTLPNLKDEAKKVA